MTEFNFHPPITVVPVLFDNVPVVGVPNIQGGQILLTGGYVRGARPPVMRLIVRGTRRSVAVEVVRDGRRLHDLRVSTLNPIPQSLKCSPRMQIRIGGPSGDGYVLQG